ncbi:unnamed protein product [Commensalibacter communis]|uniref:Major capsid protein E n=1 Tax=Commensalibacter communis TaxID=2972786 RepID=A0A9W4TSQ2_9PROT|nr:major capsid protein [Commensalibacter communis]CAI3953577.1 unnamed protein product [Commensalibacter communis]CAI3956630.1 unnamed protein product [Commensalibacter communis]CAI3956634.1 unnamed protein product [Commensalibacter communis]CAI3957014.1 unnamed protein product [Commensalibacter communis]
MSNTQTGMTLYDTATLIGVVENLKTASTFFLDSFFSQEVVSNDGNVAIDIDVGKRRMSPFVSPLVEGKLVESRRIQTKLFKPPYVKDKRAPDLLRAVRRMIGERIGGNQLTAQQRMDANLAMELADQQDMLKRRMEWMATQSLTNGSLVIQGDGYETAIIDFGRDPNLNIVLSGTDMWDAENSTANPTDDVNKWMSLVMKSSGAQLTDLIFTNSAYYALVKNKEIQQNMLNSAIRANDDVKMTLGPTMNAGARLQGYWGSFRVWLYNEWYVDADNIERPMIPDGIILGVSDQLQGTRAYGAIMDPQLGYIPTPFAPKMWFQEDPAQLVLMMQSSPLTIPTRINASFVAHVAKGYDNG